MKHDMSMFVDGSWNSEKKNYFPRASLQNILLKYNMGENQFIMISSLSFADQQSRKNINIMSDSTK